jgi:hypothetical protein
MQIYGEIKKVTPVQSGTSSEGKEWKNQMMVIETLDSHPKKVAFKVFGEDRIKKVAEKKEGELVRVTFVAESRPFEKEGVEFWSTDLVFLSF